MLQATTEGKNGQEVTMKRKMAVIFAACLIASMLFKNGPAELQAGDVFITIGGGDITGVYFPVGLAIAKLINSNRRIWSWLKLSPNNSAKPIPIINPKTLMR